MSAILLVIILALVWAAITGSFSGLNLLFGGLIAGLAVTVLRGSLRQAGAWRKLRLILALAGLFIYELMVSAIRVAWVVVQPDIKAAIRPAVIAVPLKVKSDAEIALLANLITLTPGTLSVDVSPDRSTLFVHALSLTSADALIADIATGFEARIAEIYK